LTAQVYLLDKTRDQLIPTSVKHPIWYYITDPRSSSHLVSPYETEAVIGPGISTGRIALILSSTCTCPAVIIKAHAQEPIILYNPIDRICQVVYKIKITERISYESYD
jgi:hypothetical protein